MDPRSARMVLVLLATAARAGVEVVTDEGCLSAELVELEVRAALGDGPTDRLGLLVTLSSGGPSWTLNLRASEGERVLWDRDLAVSPVDCPYVPELVARSLEAGLASIPGWSLEAPRRPPHRAGMQLFGTLPSAVRVGIGGDLWLTLGRVTRWQIALDVQQSGVQRLAGGRLQLAGAIVSTGPGLEFARGRSAIEWANRLGLGPNLSIGRDFAGGDGELARVWPRFVYSSEGVWRFANGIGAVARAEVPVVRVDFVDLSTGALYPEPLLRVGLGVEVSGRLGRSDGGRRVRP